MQRERRQQKMKIRMVAATDTDGQTKEGRTPEQADQRFEPAAMPMAPDIPEPFRNSDVIIAVAPSIALWSAGRLEQGHGCRAWA